MAKIINPFSRQIVLPTGHVVPPAGELVTTNDVLNCNDNAPMLSALARSGQATLEYDPEAFGGGEPEVTKIVEVTEESKVAADTLELLADSASPPMAKPPRAPRPAAAVAAEEAAKEGGKPEEAMGGKRP